MSKLRPYFLLLISLVGYILIAYYVERSNFLFLISIYSSLFLLAYMLQKYHALQSYNLLLWGGIFFRFIMIFSIPALSDDFYRFVWDGRIQQLGFNPFDFTPAQLIQQHSDPLLHSLFPRLNSPQYYSVYPQVCQSIFKIASSIGGESLYQSLIALKSMIFLSELGSIFLLRKMLTTHENSKSLALIYVLNPLVIIELSGNIHFEAFMILFILLALFLIRQYNFLGSASALALAIQTKLLPLIFIPLLLKKIGFKKTLSYILFCAVISILMALVLLNKPTRIAHFIESLRLYYGTFEFNGSFYRLFSLIGQELLTYNPIAVLSKIMIVISLSGMAWVYYKQVELEKGLFWLLIIYLACAAVVHPWYLTPLVALSCFNKYRFALLWSALIPFSYHTYSSIPYHENYWITAMAYIFIFGFLCWELKKEVSVNSNKKELPYSS